MGPDICTPHRERGDSVFFLRTLLLLPENLDFALRSPQCVLQPLRGPLGCEPSPIFMLLFLVPVFHFRKMLALQESYCLLWQAESYCLLWLVATSGLPKGTKGPLFIRSATKALKRAPHQLMRGATKGPLFTRSIDGFPAKKGSRAALLVNWRQEEKLDIFVYFLSTVNQAFLVHIKFVGQCGPPENREICKD